MGFTGDFEATLDSKGRFLLPANLKKMLPEGTSILVINRGSDGCLNLYPLQAWTEMEEKVSRVNAYDSRDNRLVRKALIAGATHLEIDGAGRLNVPPILAKYAELKKDLMLIGDIEKIEIWDKERYEELLEELTPAKLDEINKRAFGSEAEQARKLGLIKDNP